MIPTAIGIIQCVIGVWLVLRGTLNQTFLFLVLSSLFGASAAIQLPMLGGSSIPPIQFALAFVFLRLLMPSGGYAGAVPDAVKANLALVLFCLYGIATAIAAPRIFAGDINVVPLSPGDLRYLFDTVPLRSTPQNLTASIYLIGALLVAVATSIVVRFRGGADTLVRGAILIAWIHAITGILTVVLRGTPADVIFDVLKNGSATVLNHEYQGFIRITGLFAEASSYAAFGFGWFVFNCECWYRSIRPKATGRAALLLGTVLFFSTSSTAYTGLAIYLSIFALRALIFSWAANPQRLMQAMLAGFGAIFLAALAVIFVPGLASEIREMLLYMTIEKEGSDSGQQRLFWAMQGWDAFIVSNGFGIGTGSFRSSSLIMAILGSSGVLGIATFAFYLGQVFQPTRKSTYGEVEDVGLSLGGAAGFAALTSLAPAMLTAPSAVPGTTFAILAGAALALRPRQQAAPLHNGQQRLA